MAVIYSAMAAIGFTALNRDTSMAEQKGETERIERAQRDYEEASSQIVTIKANKRWSDTSGCSSATATKSVEFCDHFKDLEARISKANLVLEPGAGQGGRSAGRPDLTHQRRASGPGKDRAVSISGARCRGGECTRAPRRSHRPTPRPPSDGEAPGRSGKAAPPEATRAASTLPRRTSCRSPCPETRAPSAMAGLFLKRREEECVVYNQLTMGGTMINQEGGSHASPPGNLPGGGDHAYQRSSRLRVWKRGQPLIEFHCKPGRYCCEIRWAVHIDPNVTSGAISIPRGTDKI